MLCLLGHLGRSGASAPATAADAGELVEARGDIVGRFGGSTELIVQVLRRFVPDMQGPLRPARTPARRGRCRGQRRDPTYHQGQRFHRWRQRPWPAVPASWSRPCAAPIRCAAWKSSPASASTNCAPCAMPACSACRRFGDAGGVGELNPGAVASPAKDSGGPGARLHPLRPVGRITPWALSADTPEARPGLERHPFPVVQCLQASRSRSWALSRA